MIPLVAVAHGSRDPRSAQAVAAVLTELRAAHPEWDVRLAFLDLNTPSVPQVLDAVAAEGHRRAVVVPLLLGSAFHARVDLPALLAEARARNPHLDVVCSDILGADPRLVAAVRDNIVATGVATDDDSVGIALCAVGSRRPEANRVTGTVVRRVLEHTEWTRARICFATSADPTSDAALDELVRAGARTLVLAPWMLAPGLLWDRARAAADRFADVRIAPLLAEHAAAAEVVAARYVEAVASSHRLHVA